MKSKKIVFISNMAAPYQIENCKYLNELTKNEYHFLFCIKREDDRGSHWENIPFAPVNIKILKNPFYLSKKLFVNFDIFKELNTLKPDIVVIGGYNLLTGILATFWAKRNKKMSILYLERLLPSNLLKSFVKYLLFRIVSSLYNKFILVGNDAYKEYKYLKNKKNIPYLINLNRYIDNDKIYCKNGVVTFLYSGRFSKNQNTLNIVNSFIELNRKYKNIKLILSGNGDNLEEIENLINTLDLKDALVIDNNYKSWFELPKLYKKADVLLAPLFHSGWGFVVEEAMKSGLSIISTYETSSAAEYIIDNYNGLMIRPTKDDIKLAMEFYILNQEIIREHGTVNMNIKNKISYDNMIKKFDDFVSSES